MAATNRSSRPLLTARTSTWKGGFADAGLVEPTSPGYPFTAGMVLFEIPTGVVADTGGRRRSFLLSAITLLVGTLGYVSRAQSVAAGYVLGGLAMLLALPPLLLLRGMRQRADSIVGRTAGQRAPCAGQGLPQVASVDTTVRQPAGGMP